MSAEPNTRSSPRRRYDGRMCLDSQTIAECDDRCGSYGELCRVWCKDKRTAEDERGALLEVAGAARLYRVGAGEQGLLQALDRLDKVQS